MRLPHSPDTLSANASSGSSHLDRLVDDFLKETAHGRELPAIGDVVGGVYRILGELGRGAR